MLATQTHASHVRRPPVATAVATGPISTPRTSPQGVGGAAATTDAMDTDDTAADAKPASTAPETPAQPTLFEVGQIVEVRAAQAPGSCALAASHRAHRAGHLRATLRPARQPRQTRKIYHPTPPHPTPPHPLTAAQVQEYRKPSKDGKALGAKLKGGVARVTARHEDDEDGTTIYTYAYATLATPLACCLPAAASPVSHPAPPSTPTQLRLKLLPRVASDAACPCVRHLAVPDGPGEQG